MEKERLLEALFGKTRRTILGLLFSHTEEAFHLRKILRLTSIAPGAGQRELKTLSEAGIIVRTVKDNQVVFQANPNCPVFEDLKNIVIKTAGVGDVIRAALEPLSDRVSAALLYGSMAKGTAGKESDIDLLIIGEVTFGEIVHALSPSQDRLRREINPLVMSLAEFRLRLADEDHIINSIMSSPSVPLIGDLHGLG